MSTNLNVNLARRNSLSEKNYVTKITFGDRRTEMLKLELLYQKLMKKYEV